MPRRERPVRAQSIVGAARNYTIGRSAEKQAETKVRSAEAWQAAGWDFFDMIGEYHQACVVTGALLSRAKLEVLENGVPTKNPMALAALAQLFGGPEGQVNMLQQFGIHFSVAGEGWLFAPDKKGLDADDWLVASPTEISKTGQNWRIGESHFKGNPLAVRIYRRHPRAHKKADAPTRAILPILAELLQLTKRVAAQIDSRLAGAGILLLPSETEFPTMPSVTNPGDPITRRQAQVPGAQGLADMLLDQGRRAIQNPESAEAMFPLIGTTPGEFIEKARHLTFWSELDKEAIKLREEGIRRVALGMDMPPEVLLGSAGSNHWNAWLSDENNVKIHAEPLLKLLTSGLTTGYLRPSLEGLVADPGAFSIGADTSEMRMRPNRSKEALELRDRLIVSDQAAARENGFTEADLMTEEERADALIRKIAGGSTTPELVEAALRANGVKLDIVVADQRQPAEARPTPSLVDHPTRELPQEPRAAAASSVALVFAAEQLVDRALQRAGNRLKTRLGIREPVAPANRLYTTMSLAPNDLDDLLQDAWSSIGDFDYGVEPAKLARALDVYTRSVLISARPPSREGLARALSLLMQR